MTFTEGHQFSPGTDYMLADERMYLHLLINEMTT